MNKCETLPISTAAPEQATAEKRYHCVKFDALERITDCLSDENQPHKTYAFTREIDVTHLVQLRAQAKESNIGVSFTAFFVRAAVLAMKKYPYMNKRPYRFLGMRRYQKFTATDCTIAGEHFSKDHDGIVYVDVIRDADKKSLGEISSTLKHFSEHHHESKQFQDFLKLAKLPFFLTKFILGLPLWIPSLWQRYRGGALYVNSLGKYGLDAFNGAWPWPVTVTFGSIKERPFVVDGALTVRPTCTVLLRWDRRLAGGSQIAIFFDYLCALLQGELPLE